jgi:hypothetical protein
MEGLHFRTGCVSCNFMGRLMVIMDMHRHTYTDIVIFCTDNNYLIRELPAVLFLGFIEGPTCKALLLP